MYWNGKSFILQFNHFMKLLISWTKSVRFKKKILRKHCVTAIIVKVVRICLIRTKKQEVIILIKIWDGGSYRLFCNKVLRYLCCVVFQDPLGTKRLFDLHPYVHNNDNLSVNRRLLPKFLLDFYRLNSVTRSLNFFYRDSL